MWNIFNEVNDRVRIVSCFIDPDVSKALLPSFSELYNQYKIKYKLISNIRVIWTIRIIKQHAWMKTKSWHGDYLPVQVL